MSDIAERSQRLIQEFLAKTSSSPTSGSTSIADPLNVGEAFLELTRQMMADPAKLVEAQVNLWTGYMDLWRNATLRMMGQSAPATIEPEKSDRRFKDEAWSENVVFDYLKQSYLLTSKWMQKTVGEVEGLDGQTKRKVDFFTKQFVDAMAPTNFAMTNPEVLRLTAETKGENLVKGLQHLLADLEKGKGRLRISMTDETAFRVGENIAVTPGKVVFQNDLIQLIQYMPTTPQVVETPVLIIPPWINKFYILDLRPKNSLVRWLTAQGYSTFVVSWVNPDEKLAAKSFDDYMTEGAIAAINAVKKACKVKQVSVAGYCIGGTLLAGTLAYLKAKGDDSVANATFITAMTDFKDIGEIRAFVDDKQLENLDQRMTEAGGFLDGADMATTFNMLRSNDLIWSFVVNNYLMGKDPLPFDLLYWNSDSTRMPKAMHSFYLWNMYLKNKLAQPGGLSLGGVPIDLGTIDTPVYFISCKDDHIAPWASTFEGTKLMKGAAKNGRVRFVLSGSGHIGGVVNPPAANKYGYWTNDKMGDSARTWFESAKQHEGSWWTDWHAWLTPQAGPQLPARVPGDGGLSVLEDAPGSYVRVRLS
ncbi:MAG: class I poly(R)-hydroxyalkanoic acid synthase [Rhodospirillaceae bacterium]|nr:class I poly(R)-hydroxyalkanoic acid synthase [Rhodospirillaceae bacterium]